MWHFRFDVSWNMAAGLPPQASYKLWPAANLVNFALIPPSYRVLYTNLVSVNPFTEPDFSWVSILESPYERIACERTVALGALATLQVP